MQALPTEHSRNDPLALDLPAAFAGLPDRMTAEQFAALTDGLPDAVPAAPPVGINTQHHHAALLYGRSCTLPAGSLTMGLPHLIEGFAVIVGDLTMWNLAGRTRYTGVNIIKSEPGPRLVFAHSETSFFTVHPNTTGSLDPAVIEQAVVAQPHRLVSRQELLQ